MANINISDGSTYVVGVTGSANSDGDTITITNDSEVQIDADQFVPSNKWGEIRNIAIGTFRLKNAGTNGRMLVFEFNAITDNFRIERKGQMIVEGDFLEVATGDGTSGQTIDLSSVGTNNVSLDLVETIWIEKTPNGKKYPFMSLGDPSADPFVMPLDGVSGSEGTAANGFGGAGASSDWAVGRNFNFNRTTKVATFGDGTNGLVIPNGCKAYINNIQITGTYNGDYRQKSQFDTSPEGTLNLSNVEITSSIWLSPTNFTRIDLSYVSASHYFYMRDNYGKLLADNFALCVDTRKTYITYPNFTYETPLGSGTQWTNIYLDLNMRGVSSNRDSVRWYLDDCNKFENIYLNLVDRDSSDYAGNLYYANGLTMKNVNLISHIGVAHATDCVLLDWRYRGSTFAPQFTSKDTSYAQYGIRLTGICKNNKIINFRHVVGSTPPSYLIDIAFSCANIEIYNAYVDTTLPNVSNWGATAIRNYSDNTIVKNCELNGYQQNYKFSNELDAANCTYDNIFTTTDSKRFYAGLGNFNANMVEAGGRDDNLNGLPSNVGVVLTRSWGENQGTAPNIQYAGYIRMDGGNPANNEYFFESGGGAYLGNGDWYLPNIGSYVAMGNKVPLKGFKGFLDVNGRSRFNSNGLSLQECNFYYKISLAEDSLPATWTQFANATTGNFFNWYSELQSAFNAIKGANYDSNKGINFACKVENASDPNPARLFYYINFLCEIDNDYVADDASISFAGGDTTEKYEVIKASDNSVLYTFIGTGTHDFYLSTYYQEDVYFKRYKYVDGSYVLLVSTEYETQKLDYGFNGIILLYTGAEVQVASTDIQAIWAYSQRTLTEGFTATDRETINKALTTGKFLALK